MRWYISGPSFIMLAAAVGAFNHREVTPRENKARALAWSGLLFAVAVGMIVLDLAT